MGLFTSTLKSELAKATKKPGTVEDAAHVQTGFDFIDAYGGVIARGKDGEDIYHFGLPMGKIILAVGNSQGGKTTLAQQVANNMAIQLDGDVIHYDCENASVNHEGRVCNICNIDQETYTAIWTLLKGASYTTEEFKKLIFRIKEFKQKLKAKDMVEWTNLKGETIRIYPPTIVILDSIPALKPKEVIESQELDNNMVAGKMAAANGNLLTSISSLLEEFNITIIAVNHITTKITTNAYAPRKVILPGLGDDENLPGGNKWPFMASYAFKFTSGKEFKKDKDYKISGRVTNIQFLKTRSGFNNVKIPAFLHGKFGFSNELTNLMLFKDEGMLKGSGHGYFFKGHEDQKFKLAEFSKKYNEDEDFQAMFDDVATEYWTKILLEKSGMEAEEEASKENDFDDYDDEDED